MHTLLSSIRQLALFIFATQAAMANPWDELPFSADFQDLNPPRLISNPENAEPNPWAHLGFPKDFRSTGKTSLPPELEVGWKAYEETVCRERMRHGLPIPSASAPNIGPYRKTLIANLAQNWHIEDKDALPTVLITVDHNGNLLETALYERSGNDKLDKAALYAASITKYPPLPDWYKGQRLTFKINMTTVRSNK